LCKNIATFAGRDARREASNKLIGKGKSAMAKSVTRRQLLGWAGIGMASATVLAACGGGSSAPAQPAASGATTAANAPAAGSGGEVKLEIGSAGSDSKFDKETLEAPAGSKITLTFKNNASADTNKLFNWVLVQPGKQLLVVNDGLMEGEANNYVKANDPNVIAMTKLVKPGESETITFDAPPPGQYPYVSTFPGFYTRMRGVLTIK
jgi:azurin